jgi:hypothetical protein
VEGLSRVEPVTLFAFPVGVTPARLLASALSLAALPIAVSPAFAEEGSGAAAANERPAEQPAPDSVPGADRDFRDLLERKAGPLRIAPVVLMQVQALPYVGNESYLQAGDLGERGGFRLRRGRFGLAGTLYRRVPFKITAELSSDDKGTVRLHDAWFGYDRFKPLQVFAGARDVPFSRSALVDAGDSALIERPLAVRAMAPFHQLGLSAEGGFWSGALNYAIGVYNGVSRTDQFFEGYTENAAILGNRWGGLTYAARLRGDPLGDLGRTVEDLEHDKFRLSFGSSFFFSNGGTRNIFGIGGDVLIHVRGLHVLGEFLGSRTELRAEPTQPTSQSANVQSLSVVGEIGYVVLRKRLGITARFEWLNPNTGASDESDGWLLTGGISYHVLRDLLKAQLDYTHRQEIHGRTLANDALVFQFQLNL